MHSLIIFENHTPEDIRRLVLDKTRPEKNDSLLIIIDTTAKDAEELIRIYNEQGAYGNIVFACRNHNESQTNAIIASLMTAKHANSPNGIICSTVGKVYIDKFDSWKKEGQNFSVRDKMNLVIKSRMPSSSSSPSTLSSKQAATGVPLSTTGILSKKISDRPTTQTSVSSSSSSTARTSPNTDVNSIVSWICSDRMSVSSQLKSDLPMLGKYFDPLTGELIITTEKIVIKQSFDVKQTPDFRFPT